MSFVFLALLLAALAVVMEVAAIALKLTGLDLDTARFQALSALTGTGFTTREAEQITCHPARRRIAMSLMVIGHIGLAAILLGLLGSAGGSFSPWGLLAALLILFGAYRIISDKWLMRRLDMQIEKQLLKKIDLSQRPFHEVLHLDGNYLVAQLTVDRNAYFAGKRLDESKLLQSNIMILAIEHNDTTVHAPQGTDMIEAGDVLIVYGERNAILDLVTTAKAYRSSSS